MYTHLCTYNVPRYNVHLHKEALTSLCSDILKLCMDAKGASPPPFRNANGLFSVETWLKFP